MRRRFCYNHFIKQRKNAESGADMEQNAIKTVAFGGFDKEDVARCIEKLSQETDAVRSERDALQEQADRLTQEAETLREQVQALTAERDRLAEEAERLRPLEAETAQLKKELETLRPDAEAHAMLRGQVGAIECEARQRAAELEERSAEKMRKATDLFHQQYQTLMSTFETASVHMTAELRKMEVSLAQLPRTMDQTGAELNQLAAVLDKAARQESAESKGNERAQRGKPLCALFISIMCFFMEKTGEKRIKPQCGSGEKKCFKRSQLKQYHTTEKWKK